MNNDFYNQIKSIISDARNKVYRTANFAMVEAYWNIGKSIVEEQGGKETAEYGTGLIRELSAKMTRDFGKGFTITNLKYMRQFYLMFPNSHALSDHLSWTHYRLLLKVENERLVEEEKLKPEETRQFVEYSFRDGAMKTTGTDIDKIMPPVSRFGGGREKKKQGVIAKLLAFFERFFGLGN